MSKYGVFSGRNTGKYRLEKLRIWTLFTQIFARKPYIYFSVFALLSLGMGYFLPGNRIDDKLKVWHVTLGRPLILSCPRHTKTHPVKYYWGNAGPPPKHIQENKRINVLDNGLLHISSLRQEDIEDFNQKYHGISCLMVSNGHTTPSVKIAFKADEGEITLRNRL